MPEPPHHQDPESTEETLLGGREAAPGAGERPEPPPSSAALSGGRFAPGTVLESRYRIVDLLGRGGMGEVYRAEDLKLGEAVALKFLPEGLSKDGAALARLHREVRLARRITHKNVVRVHDVGEAEGTTFLAMEYVDGEDLASLLRRIGRLPEAKALELARQIAAGLAAAHERRLVHRDLKPANVMIDGEGRAKLSDFGLAGLAEELERPELAGTPLYMAPEQLAEGRATFASDVYSLGLVLYEMFSGERPFAATTRAELLAEQRERAPAPLSSVVDRVDPLVESAVAACLRHDPERRPESPLAVAAALPGGDPLAAALAAGETPSPEMVARAGGQAALARPWAATLVAATIVGALATAWFQGRMSAVAVDRSLPPEVLAHSAREILAAVGWEGRYERWGFRIDEYRQLTTRGRRMPLAAWQEEAERRPTFLGYWYRSGKRPIAPTRRWAGRTWVDDPPLDTAGIATVRLDSRGRLRSLYLPPEGLQPAGAAWSVVAPPAPEPPVSDPDWAPLFAAAGLDIAGLEPVGPARAPPFWAETLNAWEGRYPGQTEPRVLVDAATAGGKVVWWHLVEAPLLDLSPPPPAAIVVVALVIFSLILCLGGWLSWRHFTTGRGDPRGATRLALFVGGSNLLIWILARDHVAGPEELSLANAAVAASALFALAAWLLYMALEPYARRLMPRRMTSWSRLLEGRFADPLVGRDLLLGLGISAVAVALQVGQFRLTGRLIWAYPHGLVPLYGPAAVVTNVLHYMTVLATIPVLAVLVAARAALRRDHLAAAAAFVVVVALSALSEGELTLGVVASSLAVTGLAAYVGLVGLIGYSIVNINLWLVPISLDPGIWWAKSSWLGLAAVVGLGVWGYRAACGRTTSDAPV